MNIQMVPFAVGGMEPDHFLTSYLVNGTVAIDAGSVGFFGSAFDQARIKHVFITHSHVDHVASLPILVENAYEGKLDCIKVYGSEHVLDSVQRDLFNDCLWPAFVKLSRPEAPFLKMLPLPERQTVEVEGLRITPIPVDHVVPTCGMLVEEGDSAILISSDTGPTQEIWDVANRTPNLKAVFLEATFPNNMKWLADLSKHLTPATFGDELAKLRKPCDVVAVHIKARFRAKVVEELTEMHLPNFTIGKAGQVFTY